MSVDCGSAVNMSYIEQVANMLGVSLYEEFTIKPTNRGKVLGYKINENTTYRFDLELVHKGFDDGWSPWYGDDAKVLNLLLLGLLEIVKIEQ